MSYLGLYDGKGCLRYVHVQQGDIMDAHVRLLLKIIEGSGKLKLETTDKKPYIRRKQNGTG